MKQEILIRLEMVQKRIGQMITMVESNKPAQKIIPKIDIIQEELRRIEKLILKSYIRTVPERIGLRKNEQKSILRLCRF